MSSYQTPPKEYNMLSDRYEIYVFKRSDGLVKIGHSKQVETRLSTIQSKFPARNVEKHCSFPIPLEPDLDSFANTADDENLTVEHQIHRYLTPRRVGGEWFDIPLQLAHAEVAAFVRHREREASKANDRAHSPQYQKETFGFRQRLDGEIELRVLNYAEMNNGVPKSFHGYPRHFVRLYHPAIISKVVSRLAQNGYVEPTPDTRVDEPMVGIASNEKDVWDLAEEVGELVDDIEMVKHDCPAGGLPYHTPKNRTCLGCFERVEGDR